MHDVYTCRTCINPNAVAIMDVSALSPPATASAAIQFTVVIPDIGDEEVLEKERQYSLTRVLQ